MKEGSTDGDRHAFGHGVCFFSGSADARENRHEPAHELATEDPLAWWDGVEVQIVDWGSGERGSSLVAGINERGRLPCLPRLVQIPFTVPRAARGMPNPCRSRAMPRPSASSEAPRGRAALVGWPRLQPRRLQCQHSAGFAGHGGDHPADDADHEAFPAVDDLAPCVRRTSPVPVGEGRDPPRCHQPPVAMPRPSPAATAAPGRSASPWDAPSRPTNRSARFRACWERRR